MNDSSINTLRQKIGAVMDVGAALSVLHWDQEVNMPPKAADSRGQQLATLSGIHHRMFTDPEFGKLLQELSSKPNALDQDDAKLVSETQYDYEKATKLPEDFVEEFAREQSRAYDAWLKARKESDFAAFRPSLEKMVELNRRKADLLGYDDHPYDALLEEYERGISTAKLKRVFAELAERQSDLVRRIMDSPHQPDLAWLDKEWAADRQWKFTLRVLEDMGYDFQAGRQDRSVHPFTTDFGMYDVRITTRLNEANPFPGLMGSIHEGGHALYEQGFQEKDHRSTLGQSISLGIHESQSRMWENMIGRSLPFWRHYAPILEHQFPGKLLGVTPEMIYSALNRVKNTLIRVEADECTYNLHIILRFEIEVALVEGELKVDGIPEYWNQKVREYLGLDVPNDAEGCLQDIHWSHGSIGYFPTYALGNLYAAQMFEVIEKDIPDLWHNVEEGNFSPLLTWLREHVHKVGRRRLANELIGDISGRPLESAPFLNYLEKKYGELYELS